MNHTFTFSSHGLSFTFQIDPSHLSKLSKRKRQEAIRGLRLQLRHAFAHVPSDHSTAFSRFGADVLGFAGGEVIANIETELGFE